MFFTREQEIYKLYETKWTSKTLAKRDELETFAAQHDSLYYVADDFTHQTFQWKYTKEKYPEITKDRLDFFQWLDNSTEKVAEFKSTNPILQPTITIYKIKDLFD